MKSSDSEAHKAGPYPPTGRWELRLEILCSEEPPYPFVVDPNGNVTESYSPFGIGPAIARGEVDERNNGGKCPDCNGRGCSWCE